MNGSELRQLLLQKWGRSFDVQLRRTQGRIFLQVMWKYLEQASFPLGEAEYLARLDEVAAYVSALGAADQIRADMLKHRDRPRIGKAVNIALAVDLGDRASEWMLEDS